MPPDLPPQVEHLWSWYAELESGRGGSGFGPQPLSYADIDAWARLMSVRPSPWEVLALRRIDILWLDIIARQLEERGKRK
ncbi:MAG: hypothetical protein K2Q10_10910 [Rhodospirillales bacterium]|nr:hypothetical protein [Rhodospirillales bacterium]